MYEDYHYNSYDEDEGLPKWWMIAYAVLFALLGLILLCGCTATRYVPVERTVTELRYRDSIRHDSIYQRDSIYIQVGHDTVYKYKQRTEYRYLFLNKADTVCHTDTLRVTEIQRVEVAKPHPWYDTLCLYLGRAAIIAVVAYILYRLRKRKLLFSGHAESIM